MRNARKQQQSLTKKAVVQTVMLSSLITDVLRLTDFHQSVKDYCVLVGEVHLPTLSRAHLQYYISFSCGHQQKRKSMHLASNKSKS